MATKAVAKAGGRQELVPVSQEIGAGNVPRCLVISEKGIRTGSQFANFMSALMSDLIEGRVTPGVGNAAVNAGGKMLKVVEMQLKFGTASPNGCGRELQLAAE
jgi:hypothetical protein